MNPIPPGAQPGFYRVILGADPLDDPLDDVWLEYRCPCGCDSHTSLPLYRSGQPKPYDVAWQWDGDARLPTLVPSIRHLDGCKFHGYLNAGVWSSAGDGAPVSPHVYRGGRNHPLDTQETPVTEQQPAAPTPTHFEAPKPSDTAVVASESPVGYIRTHVLEFVNGVLHQVHLAPHSGQVPASVLVPVPGSAIPPGLLAAVEQTVEARVAQAEKAFADKLAAIEARLDTPAPTPPAQPPSS